MKLDEMNENILLEFWEALKKVKSLHFQAETNPMNGTGWSGSGKGKLLVSLENDS